MAPSDVERWLPIVGAKKLSVTELTPEINEFNELSPHEILVKTDLTWPELTWTLPDSYKYLDLDGYLVGLSAQVEQDELFEQRLARLHQEIELFKSKGLAPILRVLIYVLDRFRETNTFWGVGRGSSCSSYLLYLMGLHEVDPVRYEIKITDFLKD